MLKPIRGKRLAVVELIVFRRTDGRWSWQLLVNGNLVASDGREGYESEDEAQAMASRIVGGEYKDAERRSAVQKAER